MLEGNRFQLYMSYLGMYLCILITLTFKTAADLSHFLLRMSFENKVPGNIAFGGNTFPCYKSVRSSQGP